MGINTGANASFGPASKDGGTPGTIAGVSGLTADPQMARNIAIVDPQATPSGNVYSDFATAYAGAGGAGVHMQIAPRLSTLGSGTHDGANNASVLVDSTQSWTVNEFVGKYIVNLGDESSHGLITANDATSITAVLYDGVDNDWDTGDNFLVMDVMNIPAGTYDLSHAYIGDRFGEYNFITIDEGANLSRLRWIENCHFTFTGATAPIVADAADGEDDTLIMFGGVDLASLGTGPLINIPAGKKMAMYLDKSCGLERYTYEVINIEATGALFTILGPFSTLHANSIRGAVGAIWNRGVVSTSGNGIDSTQANFAGTANKYPITYASNLGVSAAGFSGNLSATDTDVQTALGTIDGKTIGGVVVGSAWKTLTANTTTNTVGLPPTDTLDSFSYTKKRDDSVIILKCTVCCYVSIANQFCYLQFFHGSTRTEGGACHMGNASNSTRPITIRDRITGLSAGAETFGVRWAPNTGGTLTCDAAGAPIYRNCKIELLEIVE